MKDQLSIEDSEIQEFIEQEEENSGFFVKVKRVSPLLLLSFALHMVILLVLALIRDEVPPPIKKVVITTLPNEPVTEVEVPPEIDQIEIKTPTLVEVDEVTEDEPIVEDVVDVVEDSPLEDEISEDIVVDIPSESPVADMSTEIATLGLPSSVGGAPPSAGVLVGRFDRGRSNKRGDRPSRGALNAVDLALKWLAEHQEPDGSWDAEKYEGQFKWGYHEKIDRSVMTAMALLPFLGDGHTEVSGKYKKTVQAGVKYINETMAQKDIFTKGEGHFTKMYGSGIVLMALAETTMFGSSSQTEENANLIAEYLIDTYMKKPGQGWHYNGPGDDFSVSGWVALGLKSAKYAGLKVMSTEKASRVMNGYKKWTDEVMTNPVTGEGSYRTGGGKAASMTLIGMFAKHFLGFKPDDPFLVKAAENVLPRVSVLLNGEQPRDVYQIYYGTLAAFQQDGKLWDSWRVSMEKTLLMSQQKGSSKELGGSWNPTPDHTGKVVGRVGTTALMALCLEVYYKHPRFSELSSEKLTSL